MLMKGCQENRGYLLQRDQQSLPPIALNLLNPMLTVDPIYVTPEQYIPGQGDSGMSFSQFNEKLPVTA